MTFEAFSVRPRVLLSRARGGLFGAVLVFALVCVSTVPARAVIVHRLFRVELQAGSVPPTDPVPLLTKAARAVLRRLGVRVAAEQSVPAVSAVLNDPRHWITEYGYMRASHGSGFRIRIRFDARDLMRTLVAGGLPVWGRERPLVLCVLSLPTAEGRRLLGASSLEAEQTSFEREARKRGLPVMLPVMDLAALKLLASHLLTTAPLATLARTFRHRYAFDALVVGRLESSGAGRWRGRFRLWTDGGARRHWRSRSLTSRRSVLRHLVRRLAAVFASRDALLPGKKEQTVRVRVEGLKRLSAVVSLGRLLGRVIGVRKLALEEVASHGSAVWRFETSLPLVRLKRILVLSDRLTAVAPLGGSGQGDRLFFRYRP